MEQLSWQFNMFLYKMILPDMPQRHISSPTKAQHGLGPHFSFKDEAWCFQQEENVTYSHLVVTQLGQDRVSLFSHDHIYIYTHMDINA